MKRLALLLAVTVILIPAAGCEDTGGGGGPTTPTPAAATTPTPAPTEKAPSKGSEQAKKAADRLLEGHGPKNDR